MRSYTFHVSLPGNKRLWRKLELPAHATLEGLHLAIQQAYSFDNDHLYSFFMSGKAWDSGTEYTLPEDSLGGGMLFGAMNDDEYDEEEVEEEDDPSAMSSPLFAGLETPTPDQMRELLQLLQSDPAARQQFVQLMSQQMGIPAAMIETMFNNMQHAFQGMSDEQMTSLLQMTDPLGNDEEDEEMDDESAFGNVLTTSLDALQLRQGQTFLYLFDYGDEWQFKVKVHAINENADPAAAYPRLVESVGVAPEQYPDWDEEDEEEEEIK